MELAQQICECSSELSGARKPQDVQLAAPFRSRLVRDPADHAAEDGLGLLTRVLALLN